jgi:3-hydroxyacyl-CoA dehydrogenase
VKHDRRKKLKELSMHANTEISRIAIVGTGLIVGSWAACFLAHGLDVVATDPMSHIQSECKYPERCVTGHPFNPPHLIPLVEVVSFAEPIRT